MRNDVGGKDEELEAVRVALARMASLATDYAHTHKVQFDAYVSEGFTPDQALTLVARR